MEIYNEKINDLLGDKAGLDIHEDPDVRHPAVRFYSSCLCLVSRFIALVVSRTAPPPQRGVFVAELTEHVVHVGQGMQQVLELIALGEGASHSVSRCALRSQRGPCYHTERRHFGVTNLNDKSSRSHTIFRMIIESSERILESASADLGSGSVRVSSLVRRPLVLCRVAASL
jgi:hypothetical protein